MHTESLQRPEIGEPDFLGETQFGTVARELEEHLRKYRPDVKA